jgi:hypothetical protein
MGEGSTTEEQSSTLFEVAARKLLADAGKLDIQDVRHDFEGQSVDFKFNTYLTILDDINDKFESYDNLTIFPDKSVSTI